MKQRFPIPRQIILPRKAQALSWHSINDQDGMTIERAPFLVYQVSEIQNVVVMGTDFSKYPDMPKRTTDEKGIKRSRMGKLSKISPELRFQIRRGMVIDNWDFKEYPDPELMLMTNISKLPKQ